jgi:hypothetical protein
LGSVRKRDLMIAENLIAVVAETGKLNDAAKVEALRRSWVHPPRSPQRAVAIVDAKLGNADVRELVRDLFEARGGFTVLDAIELHVAHIRGTLPNLKPSWQALKAYEEMVLPRPE